MSSLSGSGMPYEFRRPTLAPLPSSLSPLAAPFTAGSRSLASDPIHNPPALGPTAPTMLQSSQHQRSIHADAFGFASGSEGTGAGAAPYYEPYEQWKTSWVPDVSTDGSASWIDPSQSYTVSPMDKGSAASMALKHYEQTQISPSGPPTNPLQNTYHIVPEASPWKRAQDSSFYMTGPLSSKVSRSSGMGPTHKESSMDPFSNASRSSVVGPTDPFSNGFQSSVVAPMLKELSDSFSLDASSSKGCRGLPYDKYMTQLGSSSALSPTDSSPFGPGSGLGVVPTDPLANCTGGFSSMHYGNPCRISLDCFDYLPHEQKNPVAHSTTNHTKVTIASPVAKPQTIKGDNQVVVPRELEVKCGSGNAKPDHSDTGFGMDSTVLEAVDEHNIVLDSPCWKGMPSSSQHTFSKRHTGNSCNAHALENEIQTGNLLPSETSQDKKLDSVTIGLVKSSEEKPKDGKTNQNLKPENVEENLSSAINMKDEKGKGLVSAIVSDIAGPQADVKLLIKSMHDLSQVLLTCDDDFELKEHELELLQIAMENLKSFSGRRNKTDDGGSASRTKIFQQGNAVLDNRSSYEAKDNQTSVGSAKLHDVNYKKSVLEALDKIPGDESEVQAELYKNLWIEAEVSLCTMKYELQLARTKLKMESQKCAREANTSCSFRGPKPSDAIQEVGATTLPKQTLVNLNCDMSEEKNTERPVADPDVMARFRIIKGRMDNMASENQSNAEKSLEENIMVQNKDVSSLTSSRDEVLHDEVDSDVMARLRILKRRGDVGLNIESVLPNYCSLGFSTEPHDLQPNSGSSEWEHVLRDELFPSGNSPLKG